MAKRFIDTGLFDDPWFMDLSVTEKVLWVYCITKCDHAGILEMNEKLCQFQTGIKGIQAVIKGLGDRLVRVNEQYYFIPKYLEYQYPSFPNSKVRQQDSAIKRLKEFKLFNEDTQTVIEGLVNSYDNVSVTDNGSGNEKKKKGKCLMKTAGVTVKHITAAFENSTDLKLANPVYYYNAALDWSNSKGEQRVDWVATVCNFARRDLRDNKLQLARKFKYQKEAAPDNFGAISETATHMPDSLKKKFGIK